jgi:uncharacterized membrane protein
MTLLILGLLLWTAAHVFKRIAPGQRQAMTDRMGNAAKGVIAVVLLISILLMVIGYRGAESEFLWGRSAATTGINNLLMIFSVALLGLGSSKSRFNGALRHPMLTGVIVWSLSHLLVNGDVASVVLFGGMALWALLEMVLINRAVPEWTPPEKGTSAGDVKLLVISLVLYGVISGVHTWLGYFPFGG